MEIFDFGQMAVHPITAHGSIGMTARAFVRTDDVAVTILRVLAGGEIGRHPTIVDQLLVVAEGHGCVQSADGPWEDIRAGQAVIWRAGEEHTTRAFADLTAVVIEMAVIPLV